MLWVFVGILIGWLVTNVFAGAREARLMLMIKGHVYKQVAGFRAKPCLHEMMNPVKVNGTDTYGCRWCDGVFVELEDTRVQYE